MDPNQSDLDLHCLLRRLQIFQQTTKTHNFIVICALRVNKFEFNVYAVRIFIKCTHVCAAQTTYLLFTNYKKESVSPFEQMK